MANLPPTTNISCRTGEGAFSNVQKRSVLNRHRLQTLFNEGTKAAEQQSFIVRGLTSSNERGRVIKFQTEAAPSDSVVDKREMEQLSNDLEPFFNDSSNCQRFVNAIRQATDRSLRRAKVAGLLPSSPQKSYTGFETEKTSLQQSTKAQTKFKSCEDAFYKQKEFVENTTLGGYQPWRMKNVMVEPVVHGHYSILATPSLETRSQQTDASIGVNIFSWGRVDL